MSTGRKFAVIPGQGKSYPENSTKNYSSVMIDDALPKGYNEVKSGITEQAAASQEDGANIMNDNTVKYLIDRLDQDIRDHKQEVRDRDARIQAEMHEHEKRYRDEAKEREERILAAIKQQRDDAKEREERLLQTITELKTETKAELEDIKQSVNRAEERIDATTKHVHSMVTTNFWGRIATVLAILAVGVALWAALKASLPPTSTVSTPSQTSQSK